MKPVLTRAQMRAFDRRAIDTYGVPGIVLMENAGRGAADVATRMLGQVAGARVVVVCGAGNNGGDGFVVARHLVSRGGRVVAFLAVPSSKLLGDASVEHRAFVAMGGSVVELEHESTLERLEVGLRDADLVVDALFGTGLDRPMVGRLAEVIDAMNRAGARKLAIDLPSGLDADTGATLGTAVNADATVTFGHWKCGLLTPTGAQRAGRTYLADLGVPDAIGDVEPVVRLLDRDTMRRHLAPRSIAAHKHSSGHVLVIAGSPGKIGASLLVGRGAMRAGAGLVTLASWPAAVDRIESSVLELMTTRLDPSSVVASVAAAVQGKRVAAAGSGLGLDDGARAAIEALLEHDLAKVLDADALTIFAGRAGDLAGAHGRLVITPHPAEAARMLGTSTQEIERDRFAAVRELASVTHATVVLKGAHTLVADSSGVYVSPYATPVLAVAGAGDVLTGIVAAFLATTSPLEAACAGVFCHGAAGEAWAVKHGHVDRGMMSSEIAEELPSVLADMATATPTLTH